MCNVCEGIRVLEATEDGSYDSGHMPPSTLPNTVNTGYYIARWSGAPEDTRDIHVQAKAEGSEVGPMLYRLRLEGEDWPKWSTSKQPPCRLMGWLGADTRWPKNTTEVGLWATGKGPKPEFSIFVS